ncbi:MAG: VWA domain-containing protein, partial [Phycisphaerae bacterium]|nr:VWA domain-containing protein [Phycisphaerae bacterium]
MTFLNGAILIGMFAASLPVIIHLLNRRKARVIDWGAMQFLELSVASRGRKVLLEEVILLLLRTLLLAALVFALARPLLVNRYFAGPGASGQDVVVLLDGSMSMAVLPQVSGQSGDDATKSNYFEQAKGAAVQAVDQLAAGDAVAVVLAGSSPRGLTEGLTFDRDAAKKAIREARVTDGAMNVPQSLALAAKMLSAGKNNHKQAIVVTDGRSHGWRTDSTEDWDSLAATLAAQKKAPHVNVLCLAGREGRDKNEQMTNLAIESVRLSRPVVGTDLPVVLTVEVRNTGNVNAGENVRLTVRQSPEADVADSRPVGMLAPLAAASVQLQVKFDKPGPVRLVFELEINDALPADNRLIYAMEVLKTLPVLLVNGDPSAIPDQDECFWMRAAFQPVTVDKSDQPIEFLVAPKTVELPLLSQESLDGYFAVVLANVPRLDEGQVKKLADFVRNGGGLLVAPGGKIDRAFYNKTLFDAGAGLLPAAIGEPVDVKQPNLAARPAGSQPDDAPGEEPVIALSPPVHGHPALLRSSEAVMWEPVRVFRHFPLLPAAQRDGQVATVLRLGSGGPDDEGSIYGAEKEFGRGRVILLGGPVDVAWSNAPLCKVYAVAMNEVIYYLSAPRRTALNLTPGQMLISPADEKSPPTAELHRPDGQTVKVLREQQPDGRWLYQYGPVLNPGVYEMRLMRDLVPSTTKLTEVTLRYYSVQRDPGESLMMLLDGSARKKVSERLAGGIEFSDEP